MATACGIKQNGSTITKFLSDWKQQLTDNLEASKEQFLASVLATFGGNQIGIKQLQKKLNDENIEVDVLYLLKDIDQHQTHPAFKHFAITQDSDAVSIFQKNQGLIRVINSKFYQDAYQYCIVDTTASNAKPLVESKNLLESNIADFKQMLIKDLILKISAYNPELVKFLRGTTIFSSKFGADGAVYDAVMQTASEVLSEVDMGSIDLNDPDNESLIQIYYDVIALNNFDYFLDKSLSGIVEKSKQGKFGDLNRTDYNLSTVVDFDEEVVDRHLISENDANNASNFVTPSVKKIISAIPTVRYNIGSKKRFYFDQNQSTLQLPHVLQLSHWLQLNLAETRELFSLSGLDFQDRPEHTIKTILKALHDAVRDYGNDVSYSSLTNKQKAIKKFIKSNNAKSEIATALSIYEYLWNDEDRIDTSTRSINSINNLALYEGTPRFNIINQIVQQLTQVVAPAFIEYNAIGTIWNSESDQNTISKNLIQRFENSGLRYSFLNPIKKAIYIDGMNPSESDIVSAILNNRKHSSLEAELNDSNKSYLRAVKRLLHITEANDEHVKTLLIEAEELLGSGNKLYNIFKQIAQTIKDFKPSDDIFQNWDTIDKKLNSIVKIDFDVLGQVLGSILNPTPTMTFVTITGNQIGIYRNTSTVFMFDHFRKRYKPETEAEKRLSNQGDYKPLRERSNIFIGIPGLLERGSNKSYFSNVAIPLTMGDNALATEANKLTAEKQDLHAFVGDFMSLMMGVNGNNPTPMLAILLGTYSDKSTLPQLIINGLAKFPGNVTLQKLIGNPELALKYSSAFSSVKSLDLINHVIDDWVTIFDKVLTSDLKFTKDPANLEFVNTIRNFKTAGRKKRTLADIKSISDELRSRNHSKLFEQWLKFPNRQDHFDALMLDTKNPGSVASMKAQIEANLDILNQLLALMPKSFMEEVVPQIATQNNLKVVDLLYADTYKVNGKTVYQMNRMLVEDFIKDCTVLKFDPAILYNLEKGEHGTPEWYSYDMAMRGLGYGERYQFFDSLSMWFRLNKDTVKEMVGRVDKSKADRVSLFDNIYNPDGSVNENNLAKLYFGYLTTTNFLRHQALDLTVKEAYLDKAKNKSSLEAERNDRQKGTGKRNNAYTATMIPFTMDLVNGVSKYTKIAVIDDIPGGVFNTLGIDRNVDEFDGLGFVSPIQCRMEDASLGHNHRVSTKKTFIVPVSDYSAEELKWASNEITNQKIRESLGCQRPLLSIFKRMHNLKFPKDTNICSTWKFPGEILYISDLLHNKPLYSREGFSYFRYDSLTFSGVVTDPNTGETHTQYTLTKVEVDPKTGKDKVKLDKEGDNTFESNQLVTIDSLWDAYSVLNGVDCIEFTPHGFLYSERIMDFLYELTCNVGEQTGDGINQTDITLPLRKSFIGILATKSSNKRGSSNITTGKAWEDDSIPLCYSDIEIATGGKQLDAEHHADGSNITKGTQLMLDLAQKGYTSELVENLYNAIAKVMEHSSEKFNNIIRLLGQENASSKMQVQITQKILKDIEILGTTENMLNLLSEFKQESEELGEEFIAPLSAIITDVIKSYAPELNKNVIKQKDSGLMGTLTGASGFIQSYNFNGKSYTMGDFLTQKNIQRLQRDYGNQMMSYLSSHPDITFDELAHAITLLDLANDFTSAFVELGKDNPFDSFETVLDIVRDPELRFKKTMGHFYQNPEGHFLGFTKVPVSLLKPGMTVRNLHSRDLIPVDLLTGELLVDSNNYEEILIDSNEKLSQLIDSTDYVLVDNFKPVDLQPLYLEIHTENGLSENEYTSFEAQLGTRILRIVNDKGQDRDYEIASRLVNFISTRTGDQKYVFLEQALKAKTLTGKQKTALKNLQEDCLNFANHVKAAGYSLGKFNSDFNSYYKGFNPLESFEEQLKEKILISDCFDPSSSETVRNFTSRMQLADLNGTPVDGYNPDIDGVITINPLAKTKLHNAIAFYLSENETNPFKASTLNQAIQDDTVLINLILQHPNFMYNILPFNKEYVQKLFLLTAGFDKIVSYKQQKAQIIMPNIFKGTMKLGNRNLADISPESFKTEGAHYDLKPELLNADFVVRTFKGSYNIVISGSLTDSSLEQFGQTISLQDLSIDEEGYRINSKNKLRLYKLPNESDYIIKRNGNVETIIIKSNDSKGYQDSLQLLESDENLITVEPLLANVSKSKNLKSLSNILSSIDNLNTMPVFSGMYNFINESISSDSTENLHDKIIEQHNNLKDAYEKMFLNSMYNSFLKSLDMIATRIPTQNMSSIMPMEVAGFTGNDINDVFVTKWQNWLQGSDFD